MSTPTLTPYSQSPQTLLSPASLTTLTGASQIEQDVANLKKSFEQLRSEMRFFKPLMPTGGTTTTPLQSVTLDVVGAAGEGSFRASANAASACESRTGGEVATCFRRLSAVETTCENLRDALQDGLEQFRAELKDKLKHVNPSNFGTNGHNCDAAISLDASKEESPKVLGGNKLQTVASVYGIIQTEVMREVGQLRSFIESEVQSLCSQFEVQSEKVEKNVIIASKSEAITNWLSQRMAVIGKDVVKLRESDITSRSKLSELRSRLEVVVRECDEHTKEQERRADESAAFLSSLKQETDLSERVLSLENACQQAVAMPAIMIEAAESLRAELRQVVDPLREDVNYLKRAKASSRKEYGDLAEYKDPNWRSSSHEVTSLHGRISDLEVAYAADSRLVWHFVELLQNEYVGVQERIDNLVDSVEHACDSSLMKAEASLSNEFFAMKNCNLAIGAGAAIASFSRPPVEGQLKEAPQENRLEMAITGLYKLSAEQGLQVTLAEKRIAASEAAFSADLKSLREMVAGTIMSRISALESMTTRQLGSSRTFVAQSQVQSQVPIKAQVSRTLSSESHPAIAHDTSLVDKNAARTSVPLHTNSGRSSAPTEVGRFLIWDGRGRKDHKAIHGSMRLPAGRLREQCSQLEKATHAPQSSRSAEMPSRKCSLELHPLAFSGLASLHSVKEVSPSQASTALPSGASDTSSVVPPPRRK